MSLFNKISLSVCLVLDKRIQNWFKIQQDWQHIGFNVVPFIVGDGVTLDNEVYSMVDTNEAPPVYTNSTYYPTWWQPPYNAYKAWKSHKEIFKLFLNSYGVKKFHDDYLLLLEDDIQIEPDFHEILVKCEDDINSLNIDALYLGSYNLPNTWKPTQNENLLRATGSGGFHACILSHRLVSDMVQWDSLGPMDWMLGLLHNIYNCYCIYPCIVSQYDNYFSNVEGQILKKPDRYQR